MTMRGSGDLAGHYGVLGALAFTGTQGRGKSVGGTSP